MTHPYDYLTFEHINFNGEIEEKVLAVDVEKVRQVVIDHRKEGFILRKKEKGVY